MWGCMTWHGTGYACRIDGRMDAELYCQILADEFQQTLKYYNMDPDEIEFQQDNDSKHTSRLARQWFQEHGIKVLDWPALSPDLNPIEHLWQILKVKVSEYESVAKSQKELWERVENEWDKLPVETCQRLIATMPERIAAVV